jgi:uncharacterized protein (TIGR04222 family)
MTPDRAELLARIEAFDIDGPTPPALTFPARLARENGWPRPFAARVVREYKRFVFLAVTAGRPVCPSEQVDAAWHLHLTYTRSYWKRFCGEVLGRPLHHDPTKGGPAEADKHLRMYADTFAAYREAFGHDPPADIWPPAGVRFGDDLHHVAVNTRHNWVVPKAGVKRTAAVAAAVGLVGLAGGAGGNPFDLEGKDFLSQFLWPLLFAAFALGLAIRWFMKGSAGDDVPALNWADAAYLTGGKNRLLTAAIARAVQTGSAKVSDDRQMLDRAGPEPADPLERAVWKALPVAKREFLKLRDLGTAVELAYAERAEGLKAEGLLLTSDRRLGVWFLTVLPLLLVALGAGVPRLVMGVANDKPSGYLVVTLIGSFLAFVILCGLTPRRTRKGDAALARLKAEHGMLKHAKLAGGGYDAGLAVALFGTAALVGTALDPVTSWYPRATGEASYSGGCGAGCGGGGGGDGGGGDGGGGGGCGGCGGGGGGD